MSHINFDRNASQKNERIAMRAYLCATMQDNAQRAHNRSRMSFAIIAGVVFAGVYLVAQFAITGTI